MGFTRCDADTSSSYRLAKGSLYLLGSQAALVSAGFGIHVLLGRALTPADYGLYGVVMTYLVWLEVSLTGGLPYAVRSFGAAEPSKLNSIARAALRGQIVLSIGLFALGQVFAPLIATALNDPRLILPIRVATFDIPVLGLYYIYQSILNGRGHYIRQSRAVSAYAVSKAALIPVLALTSLGVDGALLGNVLASAVGFGVAAIASGRIQSDGREDVRKLIRYSASTALLGVMSNLLVNSDVFCVQSFVGSSMFVGYYVAAATIAKAPFLLFLAISTATLPAVSRAVAEDNGGLAHRYVSQAFRLHLMLIAPIAVVISASAAGILAFIFGEKYVGASSALSIVMFSSMLFGLANTLSNMLMAVGLTRIPMISTSVALVAEWALAYFLVPAQGIRGGAVAALLTAVCSFIVVGVCVTRRFGFPVSIKSLLRILLASALIYLLGMLLQPSGVWLLPKLTLLIITYAGVLLVLREIDPGDFAGFSSLFRRKTT